MRYSYTKNKKRIITYKNLILTYHLHLSNGGMLFALNDPNKIEVIGLVFKRILNYDIPIASCIITRENIMYGCNIGVFVHKNYRRRGIGKRLLEYVNSSGNYELKYYTGTPASRGLYKDFV